MTFIDAESNRSRITCITVVAESDWMRIQNLPNTETGSDAESKKQSLHTSALKGGAWLRRFDDVTGVVKTNIFR